METGDAESLFDVALSRDEFQDFIFFPSRSGCHIKRRQDLAALYKAKVAWARAEGNPLIQLHEVVRKTKSREVASGSCECVRTRISVKPGALVMQQVWRIAVNRLQMSRRADILHPKRTKLLVTPVKHEGMDLIIRLTGKHNAVSKEESWKTSIGCTNPRFHIRSEEIPSGSSSISVLQVLHRGKLVCKAHHCKILQELAVRQTGPLLGLQLRVADSAEPNEGQSVSLTEAVSSSIPSSPATGAAAPFGGEGRSKSKNTSPGTPSRVVGVPRSDQTNLSPSPLSRPLEAIASGTQGDFPRGFIPTSRGRISGSQAMLSAPPLSRADTRRPSGTQEKPSPLVLPILIALAWNSESFMPPLKAFNQSLAAMRQHKHAGGPLSDEGLSREPSPAGDGDLMVAYDSGMSHKSSDNKADDQLAKILGIP